jgi:DNA mismatch endonuclease (patch repair protein)
MNAGLPYPVPTSAAVSAVMRANRKTGSSPEVRLRSSLHASGLRFRKNARIAVGQTWTRPDIVFTRQRVAVFVDGCFWHGCTDHGTTPRSNTSYWGPKLARNAERDATTDRALRDAGWTVVRVWEHEPVEQAAAAVAAAIRRATARRQGSSTRGAA